MENNERKAKNSEARIRANNKYKKANYQRISVDIRPEQAEIIRDTAKQFDISIAQLIINSVNEYKMNHGADTDGETAEKPQEEETENEIETEETTEETTAGAEEPAEEEEPQEDEDEDEKPEEIPAFVWEQIQRLKKADKRQTAERKAREAAERKRRRIEEGTEDY